MARPVLNSDNRRETKFIERCPERGRPDWNRAEAYKDTDVMSSHSNIY